MTAVELTAAEVLDSPPSSDETVIAIPPEGRDTGRARVFLRIGDRRSVVIGSFEIGHMSVGTICMMPDDKHLFVSAKGAGYIIDLKSRTLVEVIGTQVAGVTVDAPRTLFVVDHNGMSLELFGKSGHSWKTDTISTGGFRETAYRHQARRRSAPSIPAGMGPFFRETGDGRGSFRGCGLKKGRDRVSTAGGQTTRRGGRDGALEKARQPNSLLEFFQPAPAGGLVLDLKRKRDKTRKIRW